MSPVKVILLACGSFNPPTNMHLRMFEIARDHLHRLGSHVVIGGLISPVHDGYGKKDLEAATHRLAMVRVALQNSDWIKLSDWECKQETWSRTKQVLQYHQNHVNAILHSSRNSHFDKLNEDDVHWVPDNVRNGCEDSVQIKLLCGADLLESFGTPGLWSDDDIEAIVGQHGLVVITRSNTNPLEFIYNSDMLTKYMSNITIVTEWIRNEVSSTKIRRALRRSESVKYLLPDKVLDYIHKHHLYGSKSMHL
jgi:nicotinamide mononucleotide adenylyltransferase